MRLQFRFRGALTTVILCVGTLAVRADITVAIVNMVPRDQSDETHNDAEPNLAVNPVDRSQIAGSAFTPNRLGGDAPIYISTDGGNTWSLNFIVPSRGPDTGTGDITLRFAESGTLYAGILKLPTLGNVTRLNILRATDFTSATPMSVLVDRTGVDQPHVSSMRVPVGPEQGKDRVLIGNNDFNEPQTAAVDRALDGRASPPAFQTFRLDSRQPTTGDGPQIRCAIHPSGTVYTTFYSWRSVQEQKVEGGALIRGLATVDVVVVRDDNWGTGPNAFQALTESADNRPGRIVATGRTLPWINDFQDVSFGQERVGGDLAIATDPRPTAAGTVYLCWADRVDTSDYTLHVRQSTDRGVNWSTNDLLTLKNAKNPGLAVNSLGHVGIVFQELVNASVVANQRWRTRMQVRDVDFHLIKEFTLSDTPAQVPDAPAHDGLPYLGDYLHLMSVDRDFYGVFPASNTPDRANFPAGVTYQRSANFDQKQLLDTDENAVPASIDPFFFKVTGDH